MLRVAHLRLIVTVHTPIHECVFTGNKRLLRYFILSAKMNVDIPEFNPRAATPLLLAIEYGERDVSYTC